MEFIGTIVIITAGLFLLYASGLMKTTKTATAHLNQQADATLDLWVERADEERAREYGLLEEAWKDKTVKRSSASRVRALKAKYEDTTAA